MLRPDIDSIMARLRFVNVEWSSENALNKRKTIAPSVRIKIRGPMQMWDALPKLCFQDVPALVAYIKHLEGKLNDRGSTAD